MAMGVGGQGERLLMCNRRELQTLNVEWQSWGAVVYQTTLADCVQLTNLLCNNSLCKGGHVDATATFRSYFWPHLKIFSTAPSSNFKKMTPELPSSQLWKHKTSCDVWNAGLYSYVLHFISTNGIRYRKLPSVLRQEAVSAAGNKVNLQGSIQQFSCSNISYVVKTTIIMQLFTLRLAQKFAWSNAGRWP